MVGLWGEWHTWPYDTDTADGFPNYMPTDAKGAQLITAYDNAFNTTKLEIRYPEAAGGAANSNLGVQISNTGVAPFYYPWKLTVGLKNSAGTVVKSWDTSWDLRTIKPLKLRAFPDWNVGSDPTYRDFGYPQYFQTPVNLGEVAQGNYQWVLRVKNPLEATSASAKKLRFANATQNADGWVGLGAVTVGTGSTSATYEAEASGNSLAGGALVASCSACSGGSKVGYIGNNSGTLSIQGVNGGSGGTKSITIYYSSAVARTALVNGQSVSFPATADWNTISSVTVTRTLQSGTVNNISFTNPTGWAPDIDRITIS